VDFGGFILVDFPPGHGIIDKFLEPPPPQHAPTVSTTGACNGRCCGHGHGAEAGGSVGLATELLAL
jgi:hypothetical protein